MSIASAGSLCMIFAEPIIRFKFFSVQMLNYLISYDNI